MKKRLTGIVTSDKRDKSRRVEIERRYSHPRYGKIVRGRTVCHVHDEQNDAHEGDLVEIVESRPHSKTKRWELVRVVQRASEAVLAAPEIGAAELEQHSAAGAAPGEEQAGGQPAAQAEAQS
ncbi:MAG: 30S ribosomal protein S17 [Planctomycetes bacterium]|nr:30S ribosomal protein S17 [Planctomycetota bacterium]